MPCQELDQNQKATKKQDIKFILCKNPKSPNLALGLFYYIYFMNINTLYQHFKDCTTVCTDTRKIEKDCLYFGLKGAHYNGNEFAHQALELGAKYCVVDQKEFADDPRCILVDDVLTALQDLSSYHRSQLKLPIIALTGSNGKTTTKELINAILSKKYRTSATRGNLNNHIGVPLTLLQMNIATEIGIVEMGANHPKEIEFLCRIAQPDYGLITNFGKAHLEGFGSIDGVIKSKSELYDFLKTYKKTIFINENDPIQVQQIADYNKIYSFGTSDASNTALQLKESQPYVTLRYQENTIKSQLTGSYNFNNIAVAIAVGSYFDIHTHDIISAIENYAPTNNRSQIIEKNGNIILMDAYNANPTSMMAALENFKQLKQERKCMVIGDMFELGSTAEQEHQAIIDYLEKNNFGESYLVGKIFFGTHTTHPSIKRFETFEDLKAQLDISPIRDSFILVKGSRGMALERILDLL